MASLLKIGRAKLVVSTQGEKGSVLMVKGEGEEEKQETFEGVLQAENDVYVCPESKGTFLPKSIGMCLCIILAKA